MEPVELPLHETLAQLAEQAQLVIQDAQTIPGRAAALDHAPETLASALRDLLALKYPDGLYQHQSLGIRLALTGKDVCLATPTASGKSLVFMAVAAHLALTSQKRALVLYPTKALIRDQMAKWRSLLEPLQLAVGYIDGAVPSSERASILEQNAIVAMTPDVAHAWLLSHRADAAVDDFLSALDLLILDEAHVYAGVFGTNMAYFLRRLRAASELRQVISSTATIGRPDHFIEHLTGTEATVIDREADGSPSPPKAVLLAHPRKRRMFDELLLLLNALREGQHRFVAFADSRKMVEQLVSALRRDEGEEEGDEDERDEVRHSVYPFRSGYEEQDRAAIQVGLESGRLRGVVSTSALELGLDIGAIDLAALLGTPPSVNAFWQRVGRAGRSRPGGCLIIDDRRMIGGGSRALTDYMRLEPEPSWLYLDNRFAQFAQALCAADEASKCGEESYRWDALESLPESFADFVKNELNPSTSIPDELYALKQRGAGNPQYEFPLRRGTDKNFEVRERRGPGLRQLGQIAMPQVLRETYPGAIYYYMGEPYRVSEIRYRTGEIWVRRERRWTTTPKVQNMVFPKFPSGVLARRQGPECLCMEVEVQVSERVIGFVERRGGNRIDNDYETGSLYAQRPFQNFIDTTGVCWFPTDPSLRSESIAMAMLEGFVAQCGIDSRDVALGSFQLTASALDQEVGEVIRGPCIYDTTPGSLRLTQRFHEQAEEIAQFAAARAEREEEVDEGLIAALHRLSASLASMRAQVVGGAAVQTTDDEWTSVLKPGTVAVLAGDHAPREVRVLSYRFTPRGLMYQLKHPKPNQKWLVHSSQLSSIAGVSELILVDLVSGEEREDSTD